MKKTKIKNKFWNFAETEEERVLYISGEIVDGEDEDEEDDDEEIKSTADIFKDELYEGEGNISIWINSPGGDMLTGAQIYNLIKDYKGKVTIKIDGLAASAASVIAMAGDEVLMSPVSQIMIHNPFSCAIGDSNEMKRAADMLNEVKESIINAYELKTHLSRTKISRMMDDESWMNAYKAVNLGFADGILFADDKQKTENTEEFIFSRESAISAVMNRVRRQIKNTEQESKISAESLYKRLNLLCK
ncbi:MAG: head maturation protease, ClpP-related [Acutalibacteraceae bacterium]